MNMLAVAELAKVSMATVSRVLNGTARVNPQTELRVRQAIAALSFQPDRNARTLGSGRSGLYGLIISDITNPYFPELVKAFEDVAFQNGQDILLANTNYDPRRMEECVVRMLQRRVDGVAIMTSEMEDHLLHQFNSRNIPMVFMDVRAPERNVSSVSIEYAAGVRAAIDYLYELGHRHIAFLSGPLTLASARLREEAFRASLEQHDLRVDPALVQEGDHRASGGRASMERILAGGTLPTAVLASNDLTAIGAMGAIYDAGLSIPDDISVIGIDDIALSAYTHPPLTTIRVSRQEIAQTAFKCIYQPGDALRPFETQRRNHVIGTSLELRASVKPPRTVRRGHKAAFSLSRAPRGAALVEEN